jgi:hypothetical protein
MYETLRPVPLIEERKQLRRRSMASFRTIPVEIQTDIIELLLPNERCPVPEHDYHYNSSPMAVLPGRISKIKSQFQAIVLACPSAISVVVRACRKRGQVERALLTRKGLKECNLGPREYQECRDMHSVQPDALDLLCMQIEHFAQKLEKSRAKMEKKRAKIELEERRKVEEKRRKVEEARALVEMEVLRTIAKLEKAQVRAESKKNRKQAQLMESRKQAEVEEASPKKAKLKKRYARPSQPVRQSLRLAALAAVSWKRKKQA